MSKYRKLEDIPLHCFSNKECTKSPNPALREYLRYMLDNHPNDLEYLWRWTQSWTSFGGCYNISFEAWKQKLDTDLKKQGN